MNAPTPIDHARDLLARGLSPIPVPYQSKKCTFTGWPSLRLTADDLPRYFNGTRSNIGTLLGEPAGWIVDVDIDHAAALTLADSILPTTGMEWGRASKPRSHRLYRLTRPVETRKWTSTNAGMLVELRSTGCQTIAPGSTHPSGETVRWDADGEPATIDPDQLIAAIDQLAARVRAELGARPTAPCRTGPTSPTTTPQRPSNYGREALRREADSVAGAGVGTRNDTLNGAAFNVGTLVGGGELDRHDAESALVAAARSCGLPEPEARRTITSGLSAGMEHPRQRPRQAGTVSKSEGIAECADRSPAPTFAPVAASDLIRDYPDLRPVVVDGLLREGETMNVVAAPKIGKTWLVHSLALAGVSGGEWLGKSTTRGRVLLIDGELHRETLAYRLHRVQHALGVSDSDMGSLDVWPVRGLRVDIHQVAALLSNVPAGTYRLIILDALYRFLPTDAEENSNEAMTSVYNELDAIGKQSGAAIAVVHHASKGSQAERAVTDVGSGAGAQSRAVDTHMVLRLHEADDAVSVDAAVRSFPPMEPFVIRSTRPGWELAPELDPAKLRKKPRTAKERNSQAPERPLIAEMTPQEFAERVVGRHMSIKDDVLARAKAEGISGGPAESLLKRAEASGLVHRHIGGPNSPHRFSIDPPAGQQGAGRGGVVPTTPTPGADAPGGMGGTRPPPLPPSKTPANDEEDGEVLI